MRVPLQVGTLAAAAVALAACDATPPAVQAPSASVAAGDLQSRKMAFLHRIREADPASRTIERALMNDDGELGVILDKSVQLDDIPPLMKSLLTQMAADFPNEDLTVIAYTPSAPPLKLGTAHLDARSREMTYQPTR